jgi:hypothetical protein
MTGHGAGSRRIDRVKQAVPLFVRIGLMWWVVLLAWPWSRPFMLYDMPRHAESWSLANYTPPDAVAAVLLAALSLLHSVAAGWIVVRALGLFESPTSLGSALARGVGIAWFAVASWGFLVMEWQSLRGGMSIAQHVVAFPQAIFVSLVVLPVFAFIGHWQATSLLVLLGLVTVLLVKRAKSHAADRLPQTDSVAG